MEISGQPEGTGPKQSEEPGLRGVVRAIDGLTLRMGVITSYLDKRDTLPEASWQRDSASWEQQKPTAPPPPPPILLHCPTATDPTPLQVSIPTPTRSISMPPPAPMPAPPIPAPPPPRLPAAIPVPVPPQPVARNANAKTASPGSSDEVPLSDPSHPLKPKPSPLTLIRNRAGEATPGKYLLSAAAAVLVFLAAASPITLLRSSTPDIVKVGTVGVTGVTLTVVGMGMTSKVVTGRLPAVILTNIGSELGLVFLVGVVLLGLLPPLPASLTLTGWTTILVLIAACTHPPYITIITTLGGLSTIGLATAQPHIHPEQSFLGLTVVVGYVTAITLTTAMTARKVAEQSRFRLLYLLSANTIGLPALFMAPVEETREITETSTLMAMLAFMVLLSTQLILVVKTGEAPGGEIPEATSRPSSGTPANP